MLATIRDGQKPWARRAMGLFVIVWLNLVLQPCAMAMDGDPVPDCPSCPSPAVQEQHGHEMASADMPCQMDTVVCSVLDDINHDTRASNLKLKDAPSDLPAAIASSTALLPNVYPAAAFHTPLAIRRPPGTATPLNVLFCVYLD